MALIDKASLLMVPSTYEAGKLYNVLPSGNRAPDNKGGAGYDQTRADFDFDRGSNAAATRINSSGLIEKYRENVLLQSNNFGTTWGNVNSAETSGFEGYDGTNNAWKLESTTIYSSLVNQTLTLNGVQTFSVYAKAGTANYLVFYNIASSIPRAWYNLSNGTIESTLNKIDAKIESVGNGWYRCSMTYNQNISQVNVYVSDANGSFSSAIGSNILIQNAQLESGLCSTDYLNSTSVTAKAGVLIDLPRINYDANGENGALLLEPSRVNSIAYSENVTNSWWLKSNVTALDNQGISPEGLNNAGKITLTSTGGAVLYRTSVTIGDGVLSFFAKPGTLSGGRVRVSVDGVGAAYWNIDGTLNAVTGGTAEAAENYGNGWYRYSYNVPSGSVANYGVQGGVIGESMLVYGIQAEPNASYATSYIPNHSGTGGVTRAADSCTGGGSAESINSVEGVLYAEVAAFNESGPSAGVISLNDGGNTNRVKIELDAGQIKVRIDTTAGQVASLNYTIAITNYLKIAVKWKANDYALWINGIEGPTDTSGASFVADILSKLSFNRGDGNEVFNGNVKQVAVFNEALSDSELATLTTL